MSGFMVRFGADGYFARWGCKVPASERRAFVNLLVNTTRMVRGLSVDIGAHYCLRGFDNWLWSFDNTIKRQSCDRVICPTVY
jgi:hypothetical protein